VLPHLLPQRTWLASISRLGEDCRSSREAAPSAEPGLGHVGLAHHGGRPLVRAVCGGNTLAVQELGDVGEGLSLRELRPDLRPPAPVPLVAPRVGESNVLGDEPTAIRIERRVVVARGRPLVARGSRPDRKRRAPCGGSTAASRTSGRGVGRARPSAAHPAPPATATRKSFTGRSTTISHGISNPCGGTIASILRLGLDLAERQSNPLDLARRGRRAHVYLHLPHRQIFAGTRFRFRRPTGKACLEEVGETR
jgi:hypothetical protein